MKLRNGDLFLYNCIISSFTKYNIIFFIYIIKMKVKRDVAIGIDSRTKFSCIVIFILNIIEIIPNEKGDPTTSSIVTFSGDIIYTGEEVLKIQAKDPKNTIYGVKSLRGRYYEDKEIQEKIKEYREFKVEQRE